MSLLSLLPTIDSSVLCPSGADLMARRPLSFTTPELKVHIALSSKDRSSMIRVLAIIDEAIESWNIQYNSWHENFHARARALKLPPCTSGLLPESVRSAPGFDELVQMEKDMGDRLDFCRERAMEYVSLRRLLLGELRQMDSLECIKRIEERNAAIDVGDA